MVRALTVYLLAIELLATYYWMRLRLRFAAPAKHERIQTDAYRSMSRRIRRTATKLQGLYIKVGQLLSILANALPEAFRAELEGLQDRVPPRSFSDIRKRLLREYGRPPEEVFQELDTAPLAAASIAQVHAATTREGIRVAIKVQYPEIERLVRTDLRALRRIFGWLDRLFPNHGWNTIYADLRSMILAELNFEREAANLEAIAENMKGNPNVAFPKVLRDYTTKRVLCATLEPGTKISDRESLDAAQVDKSRLARILIEAYCEQIFEHGLYHADPHPGNLLVRKREDGDLQIVFLDFGAVGRVSEDMRRGMASLVLGALANDTGRVVEALRTMGFVAKSADPEIYQTIIAFFHRKLQDEIELRRLSFRDIRLEASKGFETLADLRDMNVSLSDLARQFRVPKDWILLERTILLLTGLCTELDPDLNPMEILVPYLKRFVMGDREPMNLLTEAAKDVLLATVALPGQLKHALEQLEQGRIQVRIRGLQEGLAGVERALRQAIVLGMAGGACWLALALYDRGLTRESRWVGTAGLVLAGWLLVSLLRGPRRT